MAGSVCPAPKVDVPTEDVRTSDYYRTVHLPPRFDHPSWFQGYGCQRKPLTHPFYRTTSLDYGWLTPSIHTVPTMFFPRNGRFSAAQGVGGMYRNYSLNT